jgi:hypothetical protein
MIHDSILVLCFQVLSAKKRSLFYCQASGRSFLGSLKQNDRYFTARLEGDRFHLLAKNDRYFTASF